MNLPSVNDPIRFTDHFIELPAPHVDHRFKTITNFRASDCKRFDSLVVISHHERTHDAG